MRSRPLFLIASWLGLAVLAAPAFGAEPGAAPGVIAPIGPRVSAGETVELRWSSLPAGADELELLLSVDGGRSFVLRVSPELEGRERHFRWRVPNVATSEARVRIRARLGGREVELTASAPFAIEPTPGVETASPQFNEGTWWNGLDAPGRALPAAIGAPVHSLGPSRESQGVTLPSRDSLADPTERTRDLSSCAPVAPPRPPAVVRPNLPSFIPPRE